MNNKISTARGRELGNGLRAAIEQSDLCAREIAALLGRHESKISNLLGGKGYTDETELAVVLGLCRTRAPEREHLQSLLVGIARDGWWQQHGKCGPLRNRTFDENLVAAKTFVRWHTHMVPDGLQTTSYARAVLRASSTTPDKELEARLKAHLTTQNQILHHPRLSRTFYIHEIALRWRVDSEEAHIEQLQHLRRIATRPGIRIRIVPEAQGAHAGLRGPFTYLGFDQYDPLVWLENENSSLIIENPEGVAGYAMVIEALAAASLDANESKAAIDALLRVSDEQSP